MHRIEFLKSTVLDRASLANQMRDRPFAVSGTVMRTLPLLNCSAVKSGNGSATWIVGDTRCVRFHWSRRWWGTQSTLIIAASVTNGTFKASLIVLASTCDVSLPQKSADTKALPAFLSGERQVRFFFITLGWFLIISRIHLRPQSQCHGLLSIVRPKSAFCRIIRSNRPSGREAIALSLNTSCFKDLDIDSNAPAWMVFTSEPYR